MLFREIQPLKNKFVYLLAAIPVAILFGVLYASRKDTTAAVVVSASILLVTGIIFYILTRRLFISELEDGIELCVHFLFKQKFLLPWDSIDTVTIKKVNLLTNFGGWGIRYTMKTTGLIFSGNTVAYLQNKNGRRYAFTIVKVTEFIKMLKEKHQLQVSAENIPGIQA